MIYEYACPKCAQRFDVIKFVSEMEREERCPSCESVSDRRFVPRALYFNNTSVQHAEFNPGLGCVVKDRQHRAEICRQKGLEEVGSEPVDKLHKKFDEDRERAREDSWEKITDGWVGDGSS